MTDLTKLIEAGELESLQAWLEATGTLDVAAELSRMEIRARALLFRLLPRDRALAVFEALEPVHQQDILDGLRDERVAGLLEDLDPDDRARLFEELPASVVPRVLAGLSTTERAYTSILLGYPEDSAGRVMNPEFVHLPASLEVAEAINRIRRTPAEPEVIAMLPVTDDERRLVGSVRLANLVRAAPTQRVSEVLEPELHQVSVFDDQETAARLIGEAGLLALPVVDGEERIVGMITVDDAMRVLEEEETEDLHRAGGTRPLGRPYLSIGVLRLAGSRAPWLLALVVAAAATVNVLQFFEDTLAAVVTLALFIPLLIDTGGNAGAQASTVIVRAMAVGEVSPTDLTRVVWQEARVGILLGAALALIGLAPVALFFDPRLAIVVSATLLTVSAWATLVGSLLPILAKRAGIDPAVISAPLVTTLVDATGLVIYFLIARAILVI
ncbi:MAG: magnesium transporter [Acidimicrobiia bacterium]